MNVLMFVNGDPKSLLAYVHLSLISLCALAKRLGVPPAGSECPSSSHIEVLSCLLGTVNKLSLLGLPTNEILCVVVLQSC